MSSSSCKSFTFLNTLDASAMFLSKSSKSAISICPQPKKWSSVSSMPVHLTKLLCTSQVNLIGSPTVSAECLRKNSLIVMYAGDQTGRPDILAK